MPRAPLSPTACNPLHFLHHGRIRLDVRPRVTQAAIHDEITARHEFTVWTREKRNEPRDVRRAANAPDGCPPFQVAANNAIGLARQRQSPHPLSPPRHQRPSSTRIHYTITFKHPHNGTQQTVECGPDTLLLDAADAASLDLPYCCRTGTCCVCAVRLEDRPAIS